MIVAVISVWNGRFEWQRFVRAIVIWTTYELKRQPLTQLAAMVILNFPTLCLLLPVALTFHTELVTLVASIVIFL